MLHVYDKETDTFGEVSVDDFLAEIDAHSNEVEAGLNLIEGPAAPAARRLSKFAKPLPPGLYAVMDPADEVRMEGPSLSDRGTFLGIRLLVSEHRIPSPSVTERIALANYAGLMYQRAAKLEDTLVQMSDVYDATARAVLARTMPGIRTDLPTDIDARRTRMLQNARNIGGRLATINWWVVRSTSEEPFILGDSPVGTTVSLGYDDSWRAILSDETFVVALALGPTTALLMAPQSLVPMSGIDRPEQLTSAINRLTWRSASRFVVGRSREHLDSAIQETALRSSVIPVDFDQRNVARRAMADVVSIVTGVRHRQQHPWMHWEGTLCVFGYTWAIMRASSLGVTAYDI